MVATLPGRVGDGVIPFRDGASKQIKRIIVQVKGGGNISVTDVRDLHGTVEREQAANSDEKPLRNIAVLPFVRRP